MGDSTKNVRVGIIGLGMAGSNHLNEFAACQNATVVCAADPSPAARQRVEKEHKDVVCVDDYHRLLERDDVDLVAVITPHKFHLPVAIDAFRAGKNVFCEKPLAMNVAECDEMIAAADSAGRRLLVVQNQRANPPFHRLKRILAENDLGEPIGGVVAYLGYEIKRLRDESNWKGTYDLAGGGVLLDGGCHIIDLCNWYYGRPVSVLANCRTPRQWSEKKAETTSSILITYESGATAQVFASFETRIPGSFAEPTLEVSANLYFQNGTAHVRSGYYGPAGADQSLWYICGSDEKHVVEPTQEDKLNYQQHMLDCLLNGTEPIVTPAEARMAVAVAEAAYASARDGKAVDVP
ncbi:MAG: Gfo/Idh/MocA family oxidoreductase [Planctomycetota bacterium]|nr:Gfo/Idh/MocA family oxidoreductase [Planctomycetota bacterium]